MTATKSPGSPSAIENLNDAECDLLQKAETGELTDRQAGDEVRADFLASLLSGDRPTNGGRLKHVKLHGAHITGELNLEGCNLLCPLWLENCNFDEPINLAGAEASSIYFYKCKFPGIYACELHTTRSLDIIQGCIRGEIDLLGAHIDGRLCLDRTKITSTPAETAVNANSVVIGQHMLCRDGFSTDRQVNMRGSRIGGQLNFMKAEINTRNKCANKGTAIDAEFIVVDHAMRCDNLIAAGEFCLLGARIGGQLNFGGAEIRNEGAVALNANSVTVERHMFCREGFNTDGNIDLRAACIGGHLDFRRATLSNANKFALDVEGLTVDQEMRCDEEFHVCGKINLMNSRVGVFYFDPSDWKDKPNLRGFTYDRLGNQSVTVSTMLQWLQWNSDGFTPGIYDQLAEVYRRAGDDRAARKVAVAKQRCSRKPGNPLNWLWRFTVGYGYRTWLAFAWALGFTIVGSFVFKAAYPAHMVAVTQHPQRFQWLAYTLDVLLPIGGLGQKTSWQPTAGFLTFYWVLACAGWVLSAAVVAGLSGILKRD